MIEQILCHLAGDYTFQNSWMAKGKTQRWLPAAVHAAVYSSVFALVLCPSVAAMSVIFVTHVMIDRFRLARYWTKFIGVDDEPAWLGVWLLIINDNTWHLWINYLALRCL